MSPLIPASHEKNILNRRLFARNRQSAYNQAMEKLVEIKTIQHGRQTIKLSRLADGTHRTEILTKDILRVRFDTHPDEGGSLVVGEKGAVNFDLDM
jgi:hypothetical protein